MFYTHMSQTSDNKAEKFFDDIIDIFRNRYLHLSGKNFSLIKVIHAFPDKLPLVRALLKRNILSGLVLKRSSSHFQPDVVAQIYNELGSTNLIISPQSDFYRIQEMAQKTPLVIGDHGGYFASVIPSLMQMQPDSFLGLTEHTVNGENRTLEMLKKK